MYEATKQECKKLIQDYNYNQRLIDLLDIESNKVRQGISISFVSATKVMAYQSDLQAIRKTYKKWWQFWK